MIELDIRSVSLATPLANSRMRVFHRRRSNAAAPPKTRSGTIKRRILRKIAETDCGNLGDTSTLADPSTADSLIENRMNR
mgnify:CR=1 FL=1